MHSNRTQNTDEIELVSGYKKLLHHILKNIQQLRIIEDLVLLLNFQYIFDLAFFNQC